MNAHLFSCIHAKWADASFAITYVCWLNACLEGCLIEKSVHIGRDILAPEVQALKKGSCSHRAAGPPGFGARSAVSEAGACCWVAADRAILDLDLIIPGQAVLAGSQVYGAGEAGIDEGWTFLANCGCRI